MGKLWGGLITAQSMWQRRSWLEEVEEEVMQVTGRRTRRSWSCGAEGTKAALDGKQSRENALLQRLRHCEGDGGDCGGGQLRASAHIEIGQVL